MKELREALKKRAWWCTLRDAFPEAQEDAEADFEIALRAAYVAGWEAPVPTFSENGVTAGVAAMMEEGTRS